VEALVEMYNIWLCARFFSFGTNAESFRNHLWSSSHVFCLIILRQLCAFCLFVH
jgi:hypothetical protein